MRDDDKKATVIRSLDTRELLAQFAVLKQKVSGEQDALLLGWNFADADALARAFPSLAPQGVVAHG